MIENWIDAMQNMWSSIQGRGFTTVHAPQVIGSKTGFPVTLDASKLDDEPVAISIPERVEFKVSAGGPNEAHWEGFTQFHVAPSIDKDLLPSLLQWPGLIATAAAANMKLGIPNVVQNFQLQQRQDQITGPLVMSYGNEAEHWGFIVYWKVKEIVNSTITVATGE